MTEKNRSSNGRLMNGQCGGCYSSRTRKLVTEMKVGAPPLRTVSWMIGRSSSSDGWTDPKETSSMSSMKRPLSGRMSSVVQYLILMSSGFHVVNHLTGVLP